MSFSTILVITISLMCEESVFKLFKNNKLNIKLFESILNKGNTEGYKLKKVDIHAILLKEKRKNDNGIEQIT
ncbi:MAG: hypothetical protein GX235_04430 [Clostridiales bacterium]|nr:hypothetical protein [Clostridiales bacterium]